MCVCAYLARWIADEKKQSQLQIFCNGVHCVLIYCLSWSSKISILGYNRLHYFSWLQSIIFAIETSLKFLKVWIELKILNYPRRIDPQTILNILIFNLDHFLTQFTSFWKMYDFFNEIDGKLWYSVQFKFPWKGHLCILSVTPCFLCYECTFIYTYILCYIYIHFYMYYD